MSDAVARYYDENTRRFLARGEGGAEGAIHRAVWAAGVQSASEAVHYVDELLLREVEALGVDRPRLLDLGCGVGASLAYLLERTEGEGIGVTLSRVQAEIARERAAGAATFIEGDFETAELPPDVDLAFGIESFVHAADVGRLFANASASLRPGGRLALCDDFLAPGAAGDPWVEEFRRGWHAPSLQTPDDADELAGGRGLALVSDRDLTHELDLDRPRDRAIRLVAAAGRALGLRSPGFMALLGGNALTQCLKRGLVTYRFRVWEKRERSIWK
jgi:SAM-dependent methyltransferase